MIHLYKYFKLGIIVPFFLLSAFGLTYAQETQDASANHEIVIKGKLTDEQTGEALIGAFVYIKGTKTGAQTDLEGNFEIKATQAPPFTLAVNYIGYQNKEIEVYDTEDVIEFKLRIIQSTDEIVVIGYGEQKRSDITGSVASVPTELKSQPVSSPERLLQGSVPGVQVTQASGQPGGGASVQIRGTGSIVAGTQPLYVIDGYPIYNDETVTDAGITNGPKITPLSAINPSDIETIDVLKDASATAIYGSRGANGVIIVTTKKGSSGKSSVNYDGYYGIQSVTRKLSLMDASQWSQLRSQSLANNGVTTDGLANKIDPSVNTDWQDAAFRQAPIQNHSLSLITGSEKTRFALSGNYFNQDGVLRNTGFTRYSGRISIDHDYNKRFKLSTNIIASNTDAKVAPAGVVPAILLMPPSVPIYTSTGSFQVNNLFEGAYGNPINTLLNQKNETKTNTFLGNVAGDYKILEGLTARVLLGANVTDNKQNRYLPSTTLEGSGLGGIAQVGSVFTTNWLNENTINYTRKFADVHSFNAIVGYTQQSSVTNGSSAGSAGFASDINTFNNLGSGTTTSINASGLGVTPSSFSSSWALKSFLARINYGYKDKYLLTLTTRADGSSRFANGHQWGYFPSAAFAWNVGNEEFIKQFKTISQLKLRISYGKTGNQQIPPYQSLDQLGYYRYNLGNTTVPGFAPNTIPNPDLTWEKTTQFNVGVDFGLFRNRIVLVADYYNKKTTDLLWNVPVPSTTGLTNFTVVNGTLSTPAASVYQNLGSVQNRGFELGIQTQNVSGKKFKWNSSLVFAHNENKVLSLGNVNQFIPDNTLPSVVSVGNPIGSFIVYKTDGLVQPGTPLTSELTPTQVKDPNNKNLALAGQQQYVDQNGDGKITQDGDRVIINNQPKFVAGLTNTFSYSAPFGTFDLTLFFQTSYGNKIYNQNRATLEIGSGYTNSTTTLTNAYSPSNTNTDVHSAYPNPAATVSDRFIEDGSYLRLKNLTFGYSLPANLLSRYKIQSIRLYISAQNYWTWTNYTGFDPEVNSNGQSGINQGVDNGAYPNIKTYLGGLQLSF